jgi:hypothetical protein
VDWVGGQMKKKFIISAGVLIALLIGIVLLWPLSFSGLIENDRDLFVVHTDIALEDAQPIHTTANYQLQPDSEEFKQIRQILSNYSYHRTFRSFFADASMDGNDAGYWLHIYSGENEITCGGTGEIIVSGQVYRMGYWGNQTALVMMKEISELLTEDQR